MGKIETGVDRLVDLINLEKKISVDDAANKLGISKVVIQEWADFLEEEKIISIEYSFSKTFLVIRKLSHDEVKEKEKAFSSEKDAFVRKVENSLKNMEGESVGLEKIKAEFENIKKNIGGEVEKVKEEVKQLEKYEYLKKNLDLDIQKQIDEFHVVLDKYHKEMETEQKKHQILLEELNIEKRDVQLKETKLLSLEEKEKELLKRMSELVDQAKELGKRSGEEMAGIGASEVRVANIEKSVKAIEEDITKKKDIIQPLLDRAKKHEAQILTLQEEILKKAKEKTSSIKEHVDEGSKVVSNFEKFFSKKAEIEQLINDVEKEEKEIINNFRELEKRAIAFNLATNASLVNAQVKELERQLDVVNKKKGKFREDLEKLINIVKK